jgi:hypothetical protein
MKRSSLAFVQRVRSIRVIHLIDRFSELNQSVDETFCPLDVDIIVADPMNQQQVAS